MRIALVSDAIYPYNKGGKEKRLYEISTRLAERGHDVHIYCMKWWRGHENDRIENGVHLHAISPLYPLYSGKRRSIRQGILFGIACLKLVREEWEVIDVDHMPYFPIFFTKIVCILKRKRMTATWHEVWGREYWITYMGWKGIISSVIEAISIGLPDTIIAASLLTQERLLTRRKRDNSIAYIPNGVDTNHISTITPSSETSDIIFAGRLLSHKHVDVLLVAVQLLKKTLPRIRCIIIGDGPEKDRLRRMADRLGIAEHITFKPFYDDHDKLYAQIKSSKIFVLPSTREGFGLAALEAYACGIPVITTSDPDNGARFLVDADCVITLDAKVFAHKIATLLKSGTYIRKAQLIDWEHVVDTYEKFI